MALRWVKREGRIIALVKPHYELEPDEKDQLLRDGVLAAVDAQRIFERVAASMRALGVQVSAVTKWGRGRP